MVLYTLCSKSAMYEGVHYARIHKPCRRFFVVVGNRICDVGSQIYFYAVEVVRQYFSQIVVEVVELNDIGKGAVRLIFMAAGLSNSGNSSRMERRRIPIGRIRYPSVSLLPYLRLERPCRGISIALFARRW